MRGILSPLIAPFRWVLATGSDEIQLYSQAELSQQTAKSNPTRSVPILFGLNVDASYLFFLYYNSLLVTAEDIVSRLKVSSSCSTILACVLGARFFRATGEISGDARGKKWRRTSMDLSAFLMFNAFFICLFSV